MASHSAQSTSELRQHLEAGRPWLDPMTWLLVDELQAERDRYRETILWVLAHGEVGKQSRRHLRAALDQERHDG